MAITTFIPVEWHFQQELLLCLPEIFFVCSTLLLLVFGLLLSSKLVPSLSVIISKLATLILSIILLLVVNIPVTLAIFAHQALILDPFTQSFKLLIIISSIACLIITFDYFPFVKQNNFEVIILLLFSINAILFLIACQDFLFLYLALELQALCSYVLAASKRRNLFAAEAGIKYFVLGALASGFLLFGIALLYGFTGSTQFEDIAKLFTQPTDINSTVFLGFLLLFTGFLFKLTFVPFHMWAPDVYTGAPTPVSAFFATLPKLTFFTVLLKLSAGPAFIFLPQLNPLFVFVTAATLCVASIAALAQTQIKRLLAFSGIGHVGFLGLAFLTGHTTGYSALFLYLLFYVTSAFHAWAFLLCFKQKTGLGQHVVELTGLAKTQPLLAFGFSLTLFSIAGIPPLAGFYGKATVLFAALSQELYLLCLLALLSSCISCFYYIRLIKTIYFDKPTTIIRLNYASTSLASLLTLSLFIIVFFFAIPQPFVMLSHKYALLLF